MNQIKIGSREHKLIMISMIIGSIVSFAIMYSPQPLISLFADEYHVSPSLASSSVCLTTIALGFGLLFVAILSNSWGRKKTMGLSLVSTSLLAILSAFGHNFYVFLFIRFLEGISIAGFPSTAIAYLNEEFSPANIGQVIGAYVAGTAIGGFTGRVVVGAMTDLSSWHTALLILGVISLIGSLWFWIYLPESKNTHRVSFSLKYWQLNVLGCFRDKNLVSVYALGFLLMGTYVTILNYIGFPLTKPPYNLSQTIFGFLFVVNLVGTGSSVWFGKLADRYPRQNIISLAFIILFAGTLLTLHKLLIIKILGLTLVAFGFFAGHAVASGWIGLLAPHKHRAQASSFYLLFYYAGSSLIGLSGGLFLNYFGWSGVTGYVCFLSIIAICVALQATSTDEFLPKSVASNFNA